MSHFAVCCGQKLAASAATQFDPLLEVSSDTASIAGPAAAPRVAAGKNTGCGDPAESAPAGWGDGAVHSDDEEHEDGLALVYAGLPPDLPRAASLPSGAQDDGGAGAAPLQQSHPQSPSSIALLSQAPTALQAVSASADCTSVLGAPLSQAGDCRTSIAEQQLCVPSMAEATEDAEGSTAPVAPKSPQASLSTAEQEAADHAFAMAVHRQQVAEEAARRKRARDLMCATEGSAKQAKSRGMIRRGPLDTFVVRTPST